MFITKHTLNTKLWCFPSIYGRSINQLIKFLVLFSIFFDDFEKILFLEIVKLSKGFAFNKSNSLSPKKELPLAKVLPFIIDFLVLKNRIITNSITLNNDC